jgi:hypothetical protein
MSKRSIALDMYSSEFASYFKQNCSPYKYKDTKHMPNVVSANRVERHLEGQTKNAPGGRDTSQSGSRGTVRVLGPGPRA